ncbi:MAG TPA: hypothetical protein VLX85_04400 [Stellaceae bacterium]|nr:hypothetical protein [Stellaceae bacterium]
MARSTALKGGNKPGPGARKPGRRAPPGGARGGGAILTLSVIGLTVLALTALPLCLLIVAGALPTAVAILVDRHPRHYLARTVGAMNFAGVIPGALKMWEVGISFASLQQVIASPYQWLVMYGAAGLGWLLFFFVPPVVAMVLDIQFDDTKRQLEARAKALIEEWGEEVTGRKREGG